MLFLGAISVHAGQKPARYFLIAAMAAMVGALLTTLSVWGFIPHNGWTFRAVEIGMLVDATLLALALAYQLRASQERRIRAERLAQLDPLTGLNNRRAFYDKTASFWSNAIRHEHATSVMLLDIDRFKQINDIYGHAHGDEVLKALADILKQSVRQGDVLARWGGEEFIVFLPETSLQEAAALAERLRTAIEDARIPREQGITSVTASFGVAQKEARHTTLDALIASADACQYQSKLQGRNRVTFCGCRNAVIRPAYNPQARLTGAPFFMSDIVCHDRSHSAAARPHSRLRRGRHRISADFQHRPSDPGGATAGLQRREGQGVHDRHSAGGDFCGGVGIPGTARACGGDACTPSRRRGGWRSI